MHLSQGDIQDYADWSADRNPLHVDPAAARHTYFGRTIAHGMLTVTRALAGLGVPRTFEVEFRGAVLPGIDYEVAGRADGGNTSVTLRRGADVALALSTSGVTQLTADTGWFAPGAQPLAPVRQTPAVRDLPDLQPGLEVRGAYETGDPGPLPEGVTKLQARVLALCSYVVGMEVPGLRSLFTRLTVSFATDGREDEPRLVYRVRVVRLDPQFRMIDTVLDILGADGRPVAAAAIRSYVPFTPVAADPAAVAAQLPPGSRALAGTVALVCGGSRGLGGELTTALAAAGCHVYASFQQDAAAAEALSRALNAQGLAAELVRGDAGDADWYGRLLPEILARHGRLDLLVLNACAAPTPLALGRDTAGAMERYVRSNLALVSTPLAACLPHLAEASGRVVYVSSSFVDEAPAGFGHYVALKQAAEALVRTAVRESRTITALVARPPRLQTAWNDTPTGVLGTIPARQAASAIVTALGAARRPGDIDLLTDFPVASAAPRAASAEAAAPAGEGGETPELVLRLVASFTAEPLLPGFDLWFRELGLRGQVDVAPYGQIVQALLSPAEPLPPGARGATIVTLRVRDWLRELPPRQLESAEAVAAHVGGAVDDLVRALRTHRAHAATDTHLVICPSEGDGSDGHDGTLADAERRLQEELSGVPGLLVVAARDFHEIYAVAPGAVADPLREHIAHVPYQDAYFHVLATIAMRQVQRRLAPPRKVIVTDCDNTLWRGVVGEVGAEGVAFDDEHRALHATLTRLARQGVLIALCSKNEEPDVWRVFETRPDFTLARDQVVTAAINWLPKSANLASLAARLNLGLDSFIFLDDNPVECAEVRSGCPEVLTLQWPTDPAAALQLLRHTWELDGGQTTREDQRRTQLYKEEFKRRELADTLTFRQFIESLDVRIALDPLTPDTLPRASQLTLRTNQFNFTTRRRNETELAALPGAGFEVRTVGVTDRFGDYGLVGLLIAGPDGDALAVDTFLLSCRVLGRGVEHRMLAELGRLAAARGLATVRLRVEPTKRNTPARSFLAAVAGAAPDADGVLEASLPAASLADLRFEPPDQAPEAITDERPSPGAPASPGGVSLRTREAQIVRTAAELSSLAALARTIDGAAAPAPAGAMAAGDVARRVYDAFAAALRLPVEQLRAVDTLDALGCDSFRIVEITVNLTQQFPWLPSTLLFEHRAISEIAAHIAALAAPAAAGPAEPATVASAPAATADLAIVGMDVRCAGASSPSELWDLLRRGGVAVRPVDADRPYFLHRLRDGRPHWAGLLDDVDRFDAEFFGISPREAELMDPQLRIFLQVAWHALEDAGATGAAHDPETGVFVGVMYGDYAHRANLAAVAHDSVYKSWESFSLANRLSQVLGLRGPSLAIDTACSSSGTALHLACQALRAGDCRVAIVGGVNLILDPDRFAQLGRLGILSPTGRCLAFGAEADGTVLGEGAGAIVLRPLADALDRGDRVYGVVKGTGVSTGSGTVGFTAPNPQAQAEAIRRALQAAAIDPRTVSYVETHGTATALGDPIEVRGLTLAYGDPSLQQPDVSGAQHCTIGSIKPNVGHLEAGAGVVSLIKVLLQLRHRQLLPSVTSVEPNAQIPFGQVPFAIQRTLEPWAPPAVGRAGQARPTPRRAGLSSFGVGGSNVHVIVEEGPEDLTPAPDGEAMPGLLALSARSPEALAQRARDLATMLQEADGPGLRAVCAALSVGRRHFEHRAALVAGSRERAVSLLTELADGATPSAVATGTVSRSQPAPTVAFLFTGQGAQHAGMGRSLYAQQPVFRDALDACAAILDRRLERPLLSVMFAEPGSDDAGLLNQTGYTQPALFAIEYALAQMWQSFGIRPDVVLGHSVGEVTAMCVAGGLSLEDGLTLIAARGRLMQALPAGGAMASAMTDERRAQQAIAGLEDRVAVAALNGPRQTVISGDAEAVAQCLRALEADGIKVKPLTVSHAFHSPLMRPMVDEYAAVVRGIRFTVPSVRLVSCVDGRLADASIAGPEYWVRNVTDPVRFADGAAALAAEGVAAFLEIGPQPVLIGMARECVPDADGPRLWLPSLRKDGDTATPLASLGRLYAAGCDVEWAAVNPGTRATVPGYPFAGRRYWFTAATAAAAPEPIHGAGAPRPEPVRVPSYQLYETAWTQASPPAPVDGGEAGHWLVVGVTDEMIEAVATALRNRGARATVLGGLDPAAIETALATAGAPVAGVVGLLCRDGAGIADPVPDVQDAVRLLQTAAASRDRVGGRIWLATRGAVDTGRRAGDASAPAAAALWGLARTAAAEQGDVWGGIVDLDPAATAEDGAGALVSELLGKRREDQIAWTANGERLVARLVARPRAPEAAVSLDASGSYLVTGGLGALGLRTASWLVDRGARHLVLASRRGAAAEAAAAVRGLEARGAAVTIVAADVSRREDVQRLLDSIAAGPAPLRGVVHAAGVDRPAPLGELDADAIRDIFAAKALGALHLHALTRDLPLDLFVCYSSLAAVLGAASRAHYAAANAFLDGLCAHRRQAGLPALAVAWGPWKGGGIATDDTLRQFERIGNRGLDPADAVGALDEALAAGVAHVAAADIDWATFLPAYEARGPRPLVSALAGAAARPSPRRAATAWLQTLSDTADVDREDVLVQLLREAAAETLGFERADDVPADRSLFDSGMDSLSAAQFAQLLQQRLGAHRRTLIFEQPRLDALAGALLAELPLTPAEPVSARSAGPSALHADLSPAARGARIEQMVREELAATLGFDDPARLAGDQSFFDLGLDSLLAAELASRLKARLGTWRTGLVFEHPTIVALTAQLLADTAPAVEEPEPAVVGTADARAGGSGQGPLPRRPDAGRRGGADPGSAADAATARGVTLFAPGDEGALVAFQREAWPHRREDWLLPRWRWMFVDSARRLGVPPRVWLYRDGGRIAGHNGAIPVRLQAGARELDTAWLVDTMVLEAYRSQAVGSQLMLAADEQLPLALSLGQTAQMREILRRLGWVDVAPLQHAVLLLNPEQVLKGKLPSPAARAAGWGLRASNAVRGALRRRGDEPVEVRPLDRFGPDHDRLWTAMAATIVCAVRRDASYLNWKYVDQPGQSFVRLELRRDGAPRAVAVCQVREPDEVYAYRRGFLVDLVAPLDEPALLQQLLQAAADSVGALGADALVCLHTHPRLGAAVKAFGFQFRKPERFLLVRPEVEDDEARQALRDAAGWFVTQGDSDIDRPW